MPAKIIAIVGAAGKQGGSLLRAILREGPESNFAPRAITMNAALEGESLRKIGVQFVEADIGNTDALAKAIEGCYGMFCVTSASWDQNGPQREVAQAQSMALAARITGVRHVIWSTLDDPRLHIPSDNTSIPTLYGQYRVPHYCAKAEADKFFRNFHLPTTWMLTSFFWDNLLTYLKPKRAAHGDKYHVEIPMGNQRLAGIAVEDIGKCALGIFKRPESYIGRRLGIAGEHLTVADMASKMSRILRKKIVHKDITFEDFRKSGLPGCREIGNMFQFLHDYHDVVLDARSVEESLLLNYELQSFDQWLLKNREKFQFDDDEKISARRVL